MRIKIRSISILFVALALTTTFATAQINRTLETKVVDLLAQLPADDLEHTDRLMQEAIELGEDGIMPFLEYKNKCSFILCRTSNNSAIDFQDLLISNKPLYDIVAEKIKEWNYYDNCGAVVGAAKTIWRPGMAQFRPPAAAAHQRGHFCIRR